VLATWSCGTVVMFIAFHFSLVFFLLPLCSIFGCFRIANFFCFMSFSFKLGLFGFLEVVGGLE
jgi:hypothetical protein